MCSVVMPADYEMLVAHSPPVAADFLSNYSSYKVRYEPPARSYIQFNHHTTPTRRPSPTPSSLSLPPQQTATRMPVAVPRRPCLVVRPEDTHSSSDDGDLPSPTKLKKKVVFADDKGLSLTHVSIFYIYCKVS